MKLTRLILSSAILATLTLHAQAPAPEIPTQPRLLCLFLDLSSMDAADQTRARDAAIEFVQKRVPPSDLVAVMTAPPQVNMLQDFTSDRNSVLASLRAITPSNYASAANNDPGPRLQPLEQVASMLSNLPEKKVLVYISGGVGTVGIDNQAQMEASIDALRKANIVMYPLDARGLLAPQQ